MANFQFGVPETLIGSIIQVLLYGMFLPIAWACAIVLYRRSRHERVNRYLAVTFILIFVLLTTKFITDTERTVYVWTHPDENGNVSYGEGTGGSRTLFSHALTTAVTTVADAFLVYRTWVVYSRNWKVAVLPGLILAATLSTGIYSIYTEATFNVTGAMADVVLAGALFQYFTLAGNTVCTVLIAYRILTIQKRTTSYNAEPTNKMGKIATILIESAALYNALVLAQAITIQTLSVNSYVLQDTTPAVIGLVFGVIMLRSSQGTAFTGTTEPTLPSSYNMHTKPSATRSQISDIRSKATGSEHENCRGQQGDAVQIRLDKMIETKVDGVSQADDWLENDKTMGEMVSNRG